MKHKFIGAQKMTDAVDLKPVPAIKRRIEVAALQLFAAEGSRHINVKDLAQQAGVSRGTIYNNIDSVESLFEDVIGNFAAELHERIHQSFNDMADPAQRLATGIRLILRQVARQPAWGEFLIKFALSSTQLREVWRGQPMRDLETGIASGRYNITAEMLPTSTALIAGTTIGSARLIIDGHRGWLESGMETAELVLKALGVNPDDALELSRTGLPDIELPAIPGDFS